jgi:hypothetical protein
MSAMTNDYRNNHYVPVWYQKRAWQGDRRQFVQSSRCDHGEAVGRYILYGRPCLYGFGPTFRSIGREWCLADGLAREAGSRTVLSLRPTTSYGPGDFQRNPSISMMSLLL